MFGDNSITSVYLCDGEPVNIVQQRGHIVLTSFMFYYLDLREAKTENKKA